MGGDGTLQQGKLHSEIPCLTPKLQWTPFLLYIKENSQYSAVWSWLPPAATCEQHYHCHLDSCFWDEVSCYCCSHSPVSKCNFIKMRVSASRSRPNGSHSQSSGYQPGWVACDASTRRNGWGAWPSWTADNMQIVHEELTQSVKPTPGSCLCRRLWRTEVLDFCPDTPAITLPWPGHSPLLTNSVLTSCYLSQWMRFYRHHVTERSTFHRFCSAYVNNISFLAHYCSLLLMIRIVNTLVMSSVWSCSSGRHPDDLSTPRRPVSWHHLPGSRVPMWTVRGT